MSARGPASRLVALAITLLTAAVWAPSGCTEVPYCYGCAEADGGVSGGACQSDGDCPGGGACCAGTCAELAGDLANCGGCGVACQVADNGEVACVAGDCELACFPGFDDCNLVRSDGCEEALNLSLTSCGQCGHVCLLANATPSCAGGQCGIASCDAGFDDCNGVVDDGCETNLGTDPLHCNGCGDACVPAPHTAPSCVAGACAFGVCDVGFGDCNGLAGDGCESDLGQDLANCGTCENACQPVPNAVPACIAGGCGVGPCDAGYEDCDHSVWSGCEVETATDVAHCGGCDMPCPAVAHGFPACAGSACVIGGCDPGYEDCDGDPTNGCEINLAISFSNCGACGNTCQPIANGTPGCSGFQCVVAVCNAGYGDCFGGAADGCETNVLTDVDHCGICPLSCAQVAHGTRSCGAGACKIASCDAGWDDCNAQFADGCEKSLVTDALHCGTCNNACMPYAHASAKCAGSACVLGACDAGYSDCDGDPLTGCEYDTLNDPNNCGGCGITCGSGVCVGSVCTCSTTVLLIADDSPSESAVLGAALTTAGFAVTQTAVPSHQYDGTNPAPAGFGAIVLLAGGPLSTSFSSDMPTAGQTAIVNFVNAGNGLVLTEWASFQVANARWLTLAPLVLLSRTAAYSGQVSYTVDAAFTAHPIWAGLPTTFTFASTSNVGIANVANHVTRLSGSPEAIDAVVIRDAPKGRVVHVAHAGNYAPNGWTSANVQKLMANAVGWSARCQ